MIIITTSKSIASAGPSCSPRAAPRSPYTPPLARVNASPKTSPGPWTSPTSTCSPPYPRTLPSTLPETCASSRTPACLTTTTFAENKSKAPINNLEEVKSESKVTVSSKLQEAIASGEKLDFNSVVELIKNHPWEATEEAFETPDDYDFDCHE